MVITGLAHDGYFLAAIPASLYIFPSSRFPFWLLTWIVNNLRAEFTKEIVTPALGVSGVGGAMAVYGAFDAIVSMKM